MMKLKRAGHPLLGLGIVLSLISPQGSHAEAPYYAGASAPSNTAVDNSSMNAILSSFNSSTPAKSDLQGIEKRLADLKKTLQDTKALKEQEEKNFKWQKDATDTDNLIAAMLAVKDSKAQNLVRSDRRAAQLFSNFPRVQSQINAAMGAFSSSNLADSCTPGNGLDNIATLARSFSPKLSQAADQMVLLFQNKGDRDAKAQKAQGLAIYKRLLKSLDTPQAPSLPPVDVRTANFSAAARGAALAKQGAQLKQTLADKNRELVELVFNPQNGLFATSVDDELDRKDVARNCLQAVTTAEENVNTQMQMVLNSQNALAKNCRQVEQRLVQDAQTGLQVIQQRDQGKPNALAAANQAYTNWSNEISNLASCNTDQSGQLTQAWQPVLDVIPRWRQACSTGNASDMAQFFGNFTTAFTTAFQQTAQLVEAPDSAKTACNAKADYHNSLRQQIQPVIASLAQSLGSGSSSSTPLQAPGGAAATNRNLAVNNRSAHGGPGSGFRPRVQQ